MMISVLTAAACEFFYNKYTGRPQTVTDLSAVVTGLLLVGLAEMGDGQVNHAKIAVKLLLAVGVFVAALLGRRKIKKGLEVPTGLAHGTGGTALIAMAVATLWV